MEDIDDCTAVIYKCLPEILIVRIPVGILDIIIDPHTVDEIERFLSVLIVLVKRIVEVIPQKCIYPDGIGSHLLNLLKPPQIGLLIYGIVR